VLNRALRDGPGYTGHREDANTGLVYVQQRYYDPESGRFLSADPVQANGNGGNFNRYWYANDNPYRYTDPDGRCTGSHISTSGGICANTGGYTTGTDGALQGMAIARARQGSVGSSSGGLMGKASVPSHIAPSGRSYSSAGGAAKAFGDAYYAKGVKEKSEYQTGIIYEQGGIYGKGGYDYMSPGAGPPGARMVDPTALFDAINAAGFNIVAWAHTHWDSNLMFSGADMQFVYRTHGTLFMTNRDGMTYMLNYRILNNAASGYQGAERILQYIEDAKDIQGQPVQ
jgi:RHS repeat-associated protein